MLLGLRRRPGPRVLPLPAIANGLVDARDRPQAQQDALQGARSAQTQFDATDNTDADEHDPAGHRHRGPAAPAGANQPRHHPGPQRRHHLAGQGAHDPVRGRRTAEHPGRAAPGGRRRPRRTRRPRSSRSPASRPARPCPPSSSARRCTVPDGRALRAVLRVPDAPRAGHPRARHPHLRHRRHRPGPARRRHRLRRHPAGRQPGTPRRARRRAALLGPAQRADARPRRGRPRPAGQRRSTGWPTACSARSASWRTSRGSSSASSPTSRTSCARR